MKHARDLSANEILELVFTYLTKMSTLRDYDEVIMLLADMGRALTSADRCTVWIVSDDRTKIWTKVAHGIDAIELPINSGLVGHAIISQEKLIIDDVYNDERFNPEIDQKTGYRTKSMMILPMYDNNDEIIGAFQVINNNSEKGEFDKRDLERLMLASTYAAETLLSAKLALEIEDTQREVVFTMGAIGESRSKETGNHVKRVAEYSKLLGLAYGMSEEEAELLKQASPMHDIGKIAIPDAILKKPGRFDTDEREIMNTHAELGYNMIKNSQRPLLKAASIVAYEHHEKWDGTGYPRGLQGEDIHLYGRITAIADVFDALGSDRVYKKAWNDEKIFNLFKEEKAKQFDPTLVDLFFENIDQILKIRASFEDSFEIKPIVDKKRDNQIKVLGAYGTKAKGYGTTAFYLNSKNVIDAGNLIKPLEINTIDIENIWLTHSHLDHISDIASVLDNYFSIRNKTLNIIGLPQTIQTVKKHFLNNEIWPDFSKIPLPNSNKMAVNYIELELGKEYQIGEKEFIKAFETNHTVASCGYIYKAEDKGIIITSDTYSLDTMIDEVEKDKTISSMIIECSFPSEMEQLAFDSKHLTAKLLFDKLKILKRDDLSLYINHIKPSFLTKVINEIEQYRGRWDTIILKDDEIINF